MSHWNHRVLAHESPVREDDITFIIHEVHYDKNGAPKYYTTDGVSVRSETKRGLRWVLKRMETCLDKPVLWAGDKWPQEYKPVRKKKK